MFVVVTIHNIVGLLWYGKLPKVSIYHQVKGIYDLKEIYNDPLIQSDHNPSHVGRLQGASMFRDRLHDNEDVRYVNNKVTIPIYRNHSNIGSKTLFSVIEEIRLEFYNKEE
jgi:hypothetical protein